ncbi:MAG: heme-binding protein [Hydrococcus sp. Prado102]|jgi:effector-binding domain-containing protein|nr:heme-binding protein [Hydrococcus sp. Prado102]
MKLHHLLIPLGIIAIAVVAIGAYQANSAPLPEGFPPPTADGQIEVKSYPAYRSATYRATGELATAANRAFSPLYQHISSNEISMTAPVETRYPSSTIDAIDYQTGEAQVSFLYRSTDIYPKEIADSILVEDISPMTVVSLGLVGSYNYQNYQEGLARLKDWLKQHSEYEIVGSPRRFFYDGPYIPDGLKRSEIQIPIRLKD